MSSVNLDETTPECRTFTEEDNTISPSIHGKTYKLELKPGLLFCCSETGIKFQVKSQATIEYELEYDSEYMNEIKNNGYELVGPLFNITVEPDVVSSVHLPHYLNLEGLSGNKFIIKYGHFKDGKVNLKTPTRIESSYIVLDNPTFSPAGPVIRFTSFLKPKKKSIPISGKVLLYFCVLNPSGQNKEYRTHVYLVPSKQPELPKLDKQKEKSGFKRIDKPPNTELIAGHSYKVMAENTIARFIHSTLKFKINVGLEDLEYTEVNVNGSETSISLKLATEDDQDTKWTGELTGADLEHQTAKMLNNLTGVHFVIKHSADLIEKTYLVDKILDNLKDILTVEGYEIVRSKETSQQKMRELYSFVDRWGEKEKDKFHKVLKKCCPDIIKELEDLD